MPKNPRTKSKRRSKRIQKRYGRRESDIGEVFGLTPRRGDGEDLSEAAALQRAEEAARRRDEMHAAAMVSPVSNMSDIAWTPEPGYDPEDGCDTEVDTDTESDDEETMDLDDASSEEKAHSSDEDFIVDDAAAKDYLDDKTYVQTMSEDDGDEEAQLSYLLESGVLNKRSVRRVQQRLDDLRRLDSLRREQSSEYGHNTESKSNQVELDTKESTLNPNPNLFEPSSKTLHTRNAGERDGPVGFGSGVAGAGAAHASAVAQPQMPDGPAAKTPPKPKGPEIDMGEMGPDMAEVLDKAWEEAKMAAGGNTKKKKKKKKTTTYPEPDPFHDLPGLFAKMGTDLDDDPSSSSESDSDTDGILGRS